MPSRAAGAGRHIVSAFVEIGYTGRPAAVWWDARFGTLPQRNVALSPGDTRLPPQRLRIFALGEKPLAYLLL